MRERGKKRGEEDNISEREGGRERRGGRKERGGTV